MLDSPSTDRARPISLLLILLALFGSVLQPQKGMAKPASGDSNDYAFVRIFSARVTGGPGIPLQELENIALEMGTEEVAMFPGSQGPEIKTGTWIVNRGQDEYAYTGFTLKLRTLLAEQAKLGNLQLSRDGREATALLPCWDSPVRWVFPENDASPLLWYVSEGGELIGVTTVFETQSPSGDQRWPVVVRLDDLRDNESVVQIFEYLGERPVGLPALGRWPVVDFCGEDGSAELADFDEFELVDAARTENVGVDYVTFDGNWGCGGFDIHWSKDVLDWISFDFDFVAAAIIKAAVGGDFRLTELTEDKGVLKAGTGHGYFGYDFRLGMSATVTAHFCGYDYATDVPYIPNFYFGAVESAEFGSYLLDSSVSVSGYIADKTIYSHEFPFASVGSGTLMLNAALSLSASMGYGTITTSDGLTFATEEFADTVVLAGGQYSQTAYYEADANVSLGVTFRPDICVSVDIPLCGSYDRCISEYTSLPSYDWTAPISGSVEMDFTESYLDFDSTTVFPAVIPKEDRESVVSLDRWGAPTPGDNYCEIVSYSFDTDAGLPRPEGWTSTDLSFRGDFAGLVNGSSVLQESHGMPNSTWMWAFINGSTDSYICGGWGEQAAVPSGTPEGRFIKNEIWSPLICWDQTWPCTNAELRFDVYRDLPFEYGVFYVWHVRSWTDGVPGPWRDRGHVYYGRGKDWFTATHPFGDLVEPGAQYVQVALGVWDMSGFWTNVYGPGYTFEECHSHSPLFDNVEVRRYYSTGPQWGVREIDLFQDNFSSCAPTPCTARADMAMDIIPRPNLAIVPGDSACVWVSDPANGIDFHVPGDAASGPAVYCYVSVDGPHGGLTGSDLLDDPRYDAVSTMGAGGRTWTQIQMDSTWTSEGDLVAGRYNIDLNDNLFVPGDTVWFFFGARSNSETYWSEFTGTTIDINEAASYPMEFQILPTGTSEILYVDKFDGGGVQPWFEQAFGFMDIVVVDRYDVRGPSSHVGNGLGSRVIFWYSQLMEVYKTIIWNTGDLPIGTIGDGSGGPCKEDDTVCLFGFLNSDPAFSGVYFSGDNIAEEWDAGLASYGGNMRQLNIYFALKNGDHRDGCAQATWPEVVAQPTSLVGFYHGGYPDTIAAFGGYPLVNDFDVFSSSAATLEMAYENNPTNGAVVAQEIVNMEGGLARVVLSGISYHNIYNATGVQFPYPARVDHLFKILNWFENGVSDPVATENRTKSTNDLAQNFPNPFNPTTTIKYSIAEPSVVTLTIYNVAGKLVRTLIDLEMQYPDQVRPVTWDGRNNSGQNVSSGVYFYSLVTKDFKKTKKMVVLK